MCGRMLWFVFKYSNWESPAAVKAFWTGCGLTRDMCCNKSFVIGCVSGIHQELWLTGCVCAVQAITTGHSRSHRDILSGCCAVIFTRTFC